MRVLSVLGLKDAFYSLRVSENSKRYCGIYHILVALLSVSKNAYAIKYLNINLAIIYKCNFRLFAKQEIL